jgi:hypothetical protein
MKVDILTSYRKNRLIHEHVHDPYKTKSKPPEPTVCPICYAVLRFFSVSMLSTSSMPLRISWIASR